MNISCVICSDLFNPGAEVYSTKCGHMFHYECLINWIERSKTCPQCRNKSTEETIHRVYFNLANTDGITDDVVTLNSKLENAQFQLSLKQKDLKSYEERFKKFKTQTMLLRDEISVLEAHKMTQETVIHALKNQISYFKKKANESDRLYDENAKLKSEIKSMENVQVALTGTREQVTEILRNEHNVDSLAILVATLKKSLLDVEAKKRSMEHNLKRAQNDANRYRREFNAMECQNNELRKELQALKESSTDEKQYLKNKITELMHKLSSRDSHLANSSINRIVAESPVNIKRKPTKPVRVEENEPSSPPVAEQVQNIMLANSPYLPVKSRGLALNYESVLSGKSKLAASQDGFSIFKSKSKGLESGRTARSNNGVTYNGLGGSSKEDIFPTAKARVPLKRNKSSSSLPPNKFRKLAPSATKTKVTDFFPTD